MSCDTQIMKEQLKVVPVEGQTFVVAVAYHKNKTKNFFHEIKFYGEMIQNAMIYNQMKDCYVVNCFGYWVLGSIDKCFAAQGLENQHLTYLELPIEIIKRNLEESDLKQFEGWYDSHQSDCTVRFLQSIYV